jgi:hypothetical protein
MSNRSYSGIRLTPGIWLALLAICAIMQTASAQTEPLFYLTASPASLTLAQGVTGMSGITVIGTTSSFDNSGGAALAVSGLPSGVTGSFAVNPINALDEIPLTLAVNSSTAPGTYNVVVIGTCNTDPPCTAATPPATTTIVLTVIPPPPPVLITAPSPVTFGTVSIGTASQPIPLKFTFVTGGTVGSPAVLTQGAYGLDFADAGTGSCTTNGTSHVYSPGDTCTVNVTFTPTKAGPRYGGVEMLNGQGIPNAGTIIANAYVYGTGSGPQVTFPPGTLSTLGGGFEVPTGVAVDASGNVYIADTGFEDKDTFVGFVAEIPPGCASASCYTFLGGGSLYSLTFVTWGYPAGVAVDGSGNVYVSDAGFGAVFEMPPGCTSSSCVTTLGGGFSGPDGVAVDGSGNIYIADTFNNAVKEMPSGCASSSCVTTLGGGFSLPFGVAVDGSGNVYVGDTNNNAVKEMPPGCASSSCVTTLGGGFDSPHGVAVDGSGNVYVSDAGDGAVEEMPSGCASSSCVTTLESGFSAPAGVAMDGSGNVYIANDASYGAVQELNVTNPPNLSFASTSVGTESSDSPQTVTLKNIGNAALSFPVPASGWNPNISENFTLDSTTTCPQISPSSSPGTLAVDASCALAVDFIPQTSGTIDGSLVLTDNALNAHYATQTIGLSGLGLIPTTTNLVATSNPQEAGVVLDFVMRVVASGVGAVTNQEVILTIDGGAHMRWGLGSAGKAVFPTATLTPGVHTVTAVFPAQGGYGPSSSTLQEIIATAPASIATVSGSGLSTPYGQEITEPQVVVVKDSHGYVVPGAVVTFSGAGLRFSSTTAITNDNGQALVRTFPTAAGNFTASATVSGVAAMASFSLTGTPTLLLVKANDIAVAYGQPVPAPTYSFGPFVGEDTAATAVTGSASIATPAKQGSPPGIYGIGLSRGTMSAPNYRLAFEQGTVTITP